MSIFGYLMDSWVHTGTLVFLSLRAREYTGGDIHKVALQDRVWSQYWAISHWDAAIHYGVQLAQYYDQTRSLNATSRSYPPVYSLAIILRNTKVPVRTHESIGYPKMDISHWDAAIHCGVQLAQYCDQTRSFNAISRRSPPVYPLALKVRNTKVPAWTHESIRYPKMDISHWDAAIHCGVELAQYCDQTRSFNAISLRSPLVYSLALRRGNSLWRSVCPILWSNPIF